MLSYFCFLLLTRAFYQVWRSSALHCITADAGSVSQQLYWPFNAQAAGNSSVPRLFHLSKSSIQRHVQLWILCYSEVGIKATRWRLHLIKLLRLSLIWMGSVRRRKLSMSEGEKRGKKKRNHTMKNTIPTSWSSVVIHCLRLCKWSV